MPLYNPVELVVPTLQFNSITEVSGNSGISPEEVAFFNTNTGKVSIVNTGSTDMWIGHDNTLSESKYTARVAPNGLYETPEAFQGKVFVLQNDIGSCVVTTYTTYS